MGIRSRQVASGEGWRVDDVTCNSGPRDRPFEERHSSVCIALVTEGSFQYRTSQGSAVLAPGSLMLGNVSACFTCGHEHCVGDRCLSFHFTPEYFERIVACVPRARPEFKLARLPPVERLLPVLSDAQVIRDGGAVEEVALRLAGDVCAVLAEGTSARAMFTARDERRVTAAVRRIEVESADRIPLNELARDAAMSPYHFLRVFERVVGVTPGQYMLRARLRRAAVLLRRSSLSISSVALECGFGDLSTFNRQFRRAMRMTPNEYRARA
jgi:AraC family transcriptional regulator